MVLHIIVEDSDLQSNCKSDVFNYSCCTHRIMLSNILSYIMQRNEVECVTRTKFLGVIIDNKLKWNDHITYVKSKISKTIGFFYKMRQYLGRKALVNLYYSLVFPYLIYCSEI